MFNFRAINMRGGAGLSAGMPGRMAALPAADPISYVVPVTPGGLTLESFLTGYAATPQGQQLVDQAVEIVMNNPQLEAQVRAKVIAFYWEQYKWPITLALVGLLIFLATREGEQND